MQEGGEPQERIRTMSKNVDQFYNCGQQACLMAVLSLGDAKDLFHTQIRQALKVWIDAIAEVLIEAGISLPLARERAEDAIMQIQGSLVLVRALDDTTPFERVLERLPEKLLKG